MKPPDFSGRVRATTPSLCILSGLAGFIWGFSVAPTRTVYVPRKSAEEILGIQSPTPANGFDEFMKSRQHPMPSTAEECRRVWARERQSQPSIVDICEREQAQQGKRSAVDIFETEMSQPGKRKYADFDQVTRPSRKNVNAIAICKDGTYSFSAS